MLCNASDTLMHKLYLYDKHHSMAEEVNERLRQFLNDSRNWERKATNIPGVFLFRLPASKGRPASLAIEINPIDTQGSITKKRGVVIRSASELDEISRLLSHPKVGELPKKIDIVNPKREATTGKGGPDIFEI
jgi:hypothetical protein